jgi:hypothetical protein
MSCDRNECKMLFTKILGTGTNTDGKMVPGPAEGEKELKGKKLKDEAVEGFRKAVKEWAEPEKKKPKCDEKDCACSAAEPDDADWKKEPELQRDFIVGVKLSDGTTIKMTAEVHFKVKLVTGVCLEPRDKPIELGK